jgi:hypothetical protein
MLTAPAEDKTLRLKSLAVIALLLLGCSAAFGQKTYSLGFLSYDQKTQYCDYEVLTVNASNVVGVHNMYTNDCGVDPENGVMVGVQANISAGSGVPVTGAVVTLGDNSGDAFISSGGGFACGCAFLYVTKLVPATPQQLKDGGPFGWAFYYTFGGEAFLGNYGFLTKQLGGDSKTAFSFGDYL